MNYKEIKSGISNASYLTLASVISTLIGLAGMIYITRILGPHDYGIYLTVLAFVHFFGVFSLGGLNKVLTREGSKDIKNVKVILENAVFIRSFFTIFATLLCLLSVFFTDYEPTLKFLIMIYSLDLLFEHFSSFLNTIFQIFEKMKYMAVISIIFRIFLTSSFVILLHLGYGVFEMVIANLLSHFLGFLVSLYFTRKFAKINLFKGITDVRFDYFKPALIFSGIGFFISIALKIDNLMISFLGNSTEVGLYGPASNMATFGNTIRSYVAFAFFPVIVKYTESSRFNTAILIKYSTILLFFSISICIIMSYFAIDLFVYLFTDDFRFSGEIFRILVFFICFTWATLPYTIFAQAKGHEVLILKIYFLMAILNIVLNIFFYNIYGLIGIAYSTICVYGFGSIAQCILIHQKLSLDIAKNA